MRGRRLSHQQVLDLLLEECLQLLGRERGLAAGWASDQRVALRRQDSESRDLCARKKADEKRYRRHRRVGTRKPYLCELLTLKRGQWVAAARYVCRTTSRWSGTAYARAWRAPRMSVWNLQMQIKLFKHWNIFIVRIRSNNMSQPSTRTIVLYIINLWKFITKSLSNRVDDNIRVV